jgi:hypothetical protein
MNTGLDVEIWNSTYVLTFSARPLDDSFPTTAMSNWFGIVDPDGAAQARRARTGQLVGVWFGGMSAGALLAGLVMTGWFRRKFKRGV